MRLNRQHKRSALSTSRLAIGLTIATILPLLLYGSAPSWWTKHNVLMENAAADDFAPANHGQLKNIAKAAVNEMDARLPEGAGPMLHQLVDPWSVPTAHTNDFAPLNLGQLKDVARPFYDRLIATGLATQYPWIGDASQADDYALANIGQVKNLFSFTLPDIDPLYDGDGNGLPDTWEYQYFGAIGVDPQADPDGDGLTNLQEWQQHTDPGDYYNGVTPQLVALSGDRQLVKTNTNSPRPLELLVLNSANQPVPNAAVTFSIASGDGLLVNDFSPAAPTSTSITVRSDFSGKVRAPVATVLYRGGSSAGTAIVQAATGRASLQFILSVTNEGPLFAPTLLTKTANSNGSTTLQWQALQSAPAGAVIQVLRKGGDGQWVVMRELPSNITSIDLPAGETAPSDQLALRVRSGDHTSALSNLVGTRPRSSYAIIDLGEGTPRGVASDGTVLLSDVPGMGFVRWRAGTSEPLGDFFWCSDMNDRGDIAGYDYGGATLKAVAIFAENPATTRTAWPVDDGWLDQINEQRTVVGSEDASQDLPRGFGYTERAIQQWAFISDPSLGIRRVAAASWIEHSDVRGTSEKNRVGHRYTFLDIDNYGGAVGDDYDSAANVHVPLYFGSVSQPFGSSEPFFPRALNDDGLVVGSATEYNSSSLEFKLWDPASGGFTTFSGWDGYPMHITDPPISDPRAPTYIIAGNQLIVRTLTDADGLESPSPIYSVFDATELLPENSPYTDVQITSASNNGLLVASATFDGSEQHALLLAPAELMVDANRDGEMSFTDPKVHDADQTFEGKPYRFWLNDDQDAQAGTNFAEEITPPQVRDNQDETIQSIRDCEDLARLWLKIAGLTESFKAGAIKLVLKFRNVTAGDPGIRVFRAAENRGRGYITNIGWGTLQASPPFNQALPGTSGPGVASATTGVYIDRQFWSGIDESDAVISLLFEGVTEGKGELYCEIIQDGHTIGTIAGPFLDIKNIQKMYERAKAQPEDIAAPYTVSQAFVGPVSYVADPNGDQFEKPSDETDQCVIFVHGWNVSYDEYRGVAQTMFKRLWHQGFRGHFATFRWDTRKSDGMFDTGEYNRSENRAYVYAGALKEWAGTLSEKYTVNIIGHSMGNVVCGEALRQGMQIRNYLLMEAAVPMSCYDSNAFLLARLVEQDAQYQTPDYHVNPFTNESALGYRGYLQTVTGNLVNFHNPDDWALASGFTIGLETNWEKNQIDYKPDGAIPGAIHAGTWSYSYSPALSIQQRAFVNSSLSRNVVDSWEMKAFVARSRTKAVGAIPEANSFFSQNIRLNSAPYNFGRERFDHSGQFTRNIQQVDLLYKLMREIFDE